MSQFPISLFFEGLGVWLMQQGLHDAKVEDIVRGFGQRLIEGGVSIDRISLGGLMLHPVFGALDVVWHAREDRVASQMMPRSDMTTESFQDSPFFWALKNNVSFHRFRFEEGQVEPDFPIFEHFRKNDITDYLLLFESYGRHSDMLWSDLPPGMEGVILGISTRRVGGFAELEIEYVRALMRPLAISVKSSITHLLSKELLDAYLGHYTGRQVLDGIVERGDGGAIECVLFYSDLRGSSHLAEQLPLDAYLCMINTYFDCVAGAVMDHGGEVLKFIGDAVMAIFPVDPKSRPAADMCRAALTASDEAFARAEKANSRRKSSDPAIRFGIALHSGQVMYGNVGTDVRLDFTTIGPAVNHVTRLEKLCKDLDTPLLISESFEGHHEGALVSLGTHSLPGTNQHIEVFTQKKFVPERPSA
ncbi:adenylate/guanylate cyclase domain-containing protein [Jiella marina]|uniref:adenylate/guanylate cyclase domain-containing protein n=1 Tax=Jiella sp. LLJ827 TaxID=2917712 RepID=UPI002101B689|nr:adenylate/guanylate cyclase domain-containing protein [Jiella sp. LLJ827]MCQ0988738.1 adenylate/guanylate cyclase domain-containing protein [Jiella sp. LLJ827]